MQLSSTQLEHDIWTRAIKMMWRECYLEGNCQGIWERISMWLHTQFSNTLIVHQLKQRRHDCEGGLDTQTFMTLFLNLLQVLSFDWDSVSSAIQTPWNSLKNTPLCIASTTLFLVFGYPDEMSLVFDILHIEFSCSLCINDSKFSSHKKKIPRLTHQTGKKGNICLTGWDHEKMWFTVFDNCTRYSLPWVVNTLFLFPSSFCPWTVNNNNDIKVNSITEVI